MNLEYWESLKTPPPGAKKEITGGRLKGMTQICPQWRYMAMTEVFGPVGIGWKFNILSKEVLDAVDIPDKGVTKVVFLGVELYIKVDGEWSEPIIGFGGADYVVNEKYGLHTNTEAYKMALTDALGSAMKLVGVAADVYFGSMNDSKHNDVYIDYATQRKCRDLFDQVKDGLNAEQANWCMDMMKRHQYRDVIEYLNGGSK